MPAFITMKFWRYKIKHSKLPLVQSLVLLYKDFHYWSFPSWGWLFLPILQIHTLVTVLLNTTLQKFYFTPLFKVKLNKKPNKLLLYSGMPQLQGSLTLDIDEGSRISGQSSFFGRSASEKTYCYIGKNVDIGWQTTVAVGTNIMINNNVRIAGRCYLAGFPGHPENPNDRICGLPETNDQIGDIVLEENVWLASSVTVLAGVTIGKNSIIGTGSVVTKNIPENSVAVGIPAKVIRTIRA